MMHAGKVRQRFLKTYLPFSGPVLTAPSSRCRLGISLRLSMSTGAAAPTPKDEPARRSEIFKIS